MSYVNACESLCEYGGCTVCVQDGGGEETVGAEAGGDHQRGAPASHQSLLRLDEV